MLRELPKDKISVTLPAEPADINARIMPKVIQWFAGPPHRMEAVYTICEDRGEKFGLLEFVRPPDWDDDRVRTFMALVGHIALRELKWG